MLLVITAFFFFFFFFAVVAKCGAVKLHFHHKLFPQGNTGSVNSISLSIMTRIHICAGQGRFGINIENGGGRGKTHSQGLLHMSSQVLFHSSASILLFHLKRVCGVCLPLHKQLVLFWSKNPSTQPTLFWEISASCLNSPWSFPYLP